ncbi:MAG: hypothetical protein ACLQBK_16855 [Candidatus Sulfotelmatobacter sp.]
MKTVSFLTLLALALAVCNCGTRTPTTTVETTTTANWEAQLVGGVGQASLLNFVTQFTVTTVNGGSQRFVPTGFSFYNAGACFVTTIIPPVGVASLNTNSQDQVTGSMTYTITSQVPSGNVLILTTTPNGGVSGTSNATPGTIGTLSNGIVWGTWTLTGGSGDSGCTGMGTFIMCENTTTCTIP